MSGRKQKSFAWVNRIRARRQGIRKRIEKVCMGCMHAITKQNWYWWNAGKFAEKGQKQKILIVSQLYQRTLWIV